MVMETIPMFKNQSVSENLPENAAVPVGTLSSYAARLKFDIGTHIGEAFRRDNAQRQRALDVIASEYRGMTVDFEVDWNAMEPEPGQIDFLAYDAYVNFAKANGLTLHHSHLLWPTKDKSLPTWLFPNPGELDCGTRTQSEVEMLVKDHIQQVIEHTADSGIVTSWNVVNEAFNGKGEVRPQNCFYQIMGPDYVDKAFRYAREAAPTGTLVLNEYFQSDTAPGGIDLKKANGLFAYVKAAKARGVPIDAVGVQNHLVSENGNFFGADYLASLHHIFDLARDAGVQVMITEMDVYQGAHSQDDVRRVYEETLAACLQDANCVWFNTWGVSDAQTWLHRRVALADAAPLLFDANYDKKPAYYGLIAAFQQASAR
jgi:endo-1,4-beta-xylanase